MTHGQGDGIPHAQQPGDEDELLPAPPVPWADAETFEPGGAPVAHVDALTRAAKARGAELDWPSFRLGIQITHLAGLHTQRSDRDMRRANALTWSGFNVLLIVWLFGPLEAHEIAHISGVTRQSTSSGLATLEKLELISRERNRADRRRVDVTLTHQGESMLLEALRRHNDNEATWYRQLSDERKETLVQLLIEAETALGADPQD